jgi:hypothetical protein
MSAERADAGDFVDPMTSAQRATLDAVLDLIVPPSADGRMPGAAEVGVPAWLVAEAPDALPRLCEELDELDRRARERFASGFAVLAADQRQSLVDAIRSKDPSFMSRLALETVTCYYLHDRVVEGLGMELRPPAPKGYQVVKGDLSLLAPVRARGKIWRDV